MKKIIMSLLICILFPCVLVVFVHGSEILEGKQNVVSNVETKDGIRIPWEDYFIGLLAENISEEYEPEAIKAQAVVLRTQIARSLDKKEKLDSSYILLNDLNKRWNAKEFKKNIEKFRTAIKKTDREVLYYKDEIAYTPFYYLSNGMSRDAAEVLGVNEKGESPYPYLVCVDCSEDKKSRDQMQIKTISNKCARGTDPMFCARGTDPMVLDSAGYVLSIQIGEKHYSGEEFRKVMGLSSSAFSLQEYKGKLRITTMGQGHGLGMSQYTANEMAKGGASYRNILEYFYPGTDLKKNDILFSKFE